MTQRLDLWALVAWIGIGLALVGAGVFVAAVLGRMLWFALFAATYSDEVFGRLACAAVVFTAIGLAVFALGESRA